MLKELTELAKEQYVSPYHFFIIHLGLGDVDASRKTMWEMYEERVGHVILAKVAPVWDDMRSDPVFQEIIRKVGLP